MLYNAWCQSLIALSIFGEADSNIKSDKYYINNIVMEMSLNDLNTCKLLWYTCIDGVIHTSLATKDSCCFMFGSEVGQVGYQQGHIDGLLLISTQLSNSPVYRFLDKQLPIFSPQRTLLLSV